MSANRCFLGCTLLFRQFLLLLWKNFLLQIRRPIGTLFEIAIPLIGIALLVGLRQAFNSADTSSEYCFTTFGSDSLAIPNQIHDNINVYYAPNTSEYAQNLSLNYIAPVLLKSGINLVGVATQDDFNSSGWYSSYCFHNGAGIFFENLDNDDVRYSIRLSSTFTEWHTSQVIDPFQLLGPRTENPYITMGFMQLEKIINEAIIEWKTGQDFNIEVAVRQFPYPKYKDDIFFLVTEFILPVLIVVSFLYSAGVFVKELVLEKETRIRETMKMMGLSNWILWTSWFTKQLLFYLLPIIINTILLKYGGIFPKSNVFLIFIFLIMFMISGIAFCFFISVWFNSARIGLMAGLVTWFLTIIPYFPFINNSLYQKLLLGGKLGICLFPNSCVGFGIRVLSRLEYRQEGLIFSNFAKPLSLDDPLSMGWVVFMLIVDTVLFMILYWYIDAVKPGTYGVPKPLYFVFLPSYWCNSIARRPIKLEELEEISDPYYNPDAHEEEPTDLPVGIVITDLTKIYDRHSLKKRKLAVDRLSLKMYEGHITALIGHNGAGKTTTMSILTGLFPPTFGTAYINGQSVVNDMDLIRHNLGMCPQHNILFDRLTVREHLNFFGKLKGCPGHRIKGEINTLLNDLLLADKGSTKVCHLSGGMKRKLSVGIALIGGSEVVILDEPTSGMDPYARRATWDLLIKYKEGRTILLTTHFMDEADFLGDRIAIMSEGKLRCSGTSLFLKSRYGVGYHMTIVKEPHCNPAAVASLVQQHVTGSEQDSHSGTELSFVLPSQSSHQFPEFFDLLDERKEQLGISSFGISVTTMEEVFMRVSSGTDDMLLQVQKSRPQRQSSQLDDELLVNDKPIEQQELINSEIINENAVKTVSHDTPLIESATSPVSVLPITETVLIKGVNIGVKLWFQQFVAMFMKRFYNAFRYWMAILWQIIIPILFVVLALVVAKLMSQSGLNDSNEPSRVLTIKNSAPSHDISFFWADFASLENKFKIEPHDVNVLGFTDYINYTDNIIDIVDSVTNDTSVSQCCNYNIQLLDKYCVSRTTNELQSTCSMYESFGYKDCTECLSCCEAKGNQYMYSSCTSQTFYDYYDNICPYPSAVSITDQINDVPNGSLDNMNVYVAELLLKHSIQTETYNFFLRYQAGVVLQSSEPAYSVCSCNGSLSNTTSCDSSGECQCSNSTQCQVGKTSGPITSGKLLATVWYNNQPYHMAPSVLNSFYNLYLKSKNSAVTITVTNNPLPQDNNNQYIYTDQTVDGFSTASIAMFGLSFLFASFIVSPVQENKSKTKHLQFVSGVQSSSYWLAHYAWDIINAFIPSIIAVIVFASFRIDIFKGNNMAAIFLLLIIGCWAAIPVNYIFSYLFSNSLIAFILMFIFFYFGFLLLKVIIVIIQATNHESFAQKFHYILLLHPSYAVGIGLTKIIDNAGTKKNCEQDKPFGCSNYANNVFQFSDPGIGNIFLFVILESVLFISLTILIERQFFVPEIKRMIRHSKQISVNDSENDTITYPGEDSDVAAERRRVNSMTAFSQSDAVVIKNLVKEYKPITDVMCPCCPCCHNRCKLAVNSVNLIIPNGECFGLLGVNGAGKTTIFKILTGDITSTSGTSVLAGYDISTALLQAQQCIGYCPQFDALIERLTGRELLTIFARLRGVPEAAIKETVQFQIDRLGLSKYANKLCGKYSGGNKRKLSVAIALVGNPPILLLDEPTTGMDPATRRLLWDVLIGVIREGRSVILTSHSMEECEVLCTRLAIMVNGVFKCLGSLQHLKSKFGSGYTLQIKIQPQMKITERNVTDPHTLHESQPLLRTKTTVFESRNTYDATELKQFVANQFSGSVLVKEHQGSVTYQIPAEGMTWSYLFRSIEQSKEQLHIIDYSISQTTLEQVFINFAQEQEEAQKM